MSSSISSSKYSSKCSSSKAIIMYPEPTNYDYRNNYWFTNGACGNKYGPAVYGKDKNTNESYELWLDDGYLHRLGDAAVIVCNTSGEEIYKEFWKFGNCLKKESLDEETKQHALNILKNHGIKFHNGRRILLNDVMPPVVLYPRSSFSYMEPGSDLDLSGLDD